eukprot:1141700-Pelagomonas_calceolata.AAC.2
MGMHLLSLHAAHEHTFVEDANKASIVQTHSFPAWHGSIPLLPSFKLDSLLLRLNPVFSSINHLPGFSGAELANVVNESALLAARKDQDNVTLRECLEGVRRTKTGRPKWSCSCEGEGGVCLYEGNGNRRTVCKGKEFGSTVGARKCVCVVCVCRGSRLPDIWSEHVCLQASRTW